MTPREKLLALAAALDHMADDYGPATRDGQIMEAAAKAIRVLVGDHADTLYSCTCGSIGNPCSVLREAAGGDDAEGK